MKPGACMAAAIELIEEVNAVWEAGRHVPADAQLAKYYKQRRYIGSHDRGAISELVYFILRQGALLEWWLDQEEHPASSRALVILALIFHHGAGPKEFETWLDGSNYVSEELDDAEKKLVERYAGLPLVGGEMPEDVRFNYPIWMKERLHSVFGDEVYTALSALNEEAPVFLRANSLKTSREEVMASLREEGMEPIASEYSPQGIMLKKRGAMFATEAFRKGWFEMQDDGSQILADLVAAKPGDKVVDFCAGAGGKTLAIAAKMNNKGRILAWDINEKRLKQMPKRLARAGVDNTQLHVIKSETDSYIKRHRQSADWVMVDAPCTGSGTWRRNPDLKWRTAEEDLHEIVALQERILSSASRVVKPGGALVYATCSVFDEENMQQVDKFLAKNADFTVRAAPQSYEKIMPKGVLSLAPHHHKTDGFFAVVLERKAA